ncbi:Bacteriophage SPP1, head-tail adaptor [uncultured Caudovirales phage]|uniref:Bacteriophage SPP1, head-tail adaptor n=1 Tax=uncultured Caudovirales phage TaxID=2100421 RepID=A0A6J5QY55_9CAUD|nr:Bacteriophage SPP1, head-tail adaptor [uncultured Caudovirales phage]
MAGSYQFPRLSPAGERRHTFRFERPVETRNSVGEVLQTWETVCRRRGSIQQVGYQESVERHQTIGQSSFEIVVPFVRYQDGREIDGKCRIVWESNRGRVLYPTAVVADGTLEHSFQASEKTT